MWSVAFNGVSIFVNQKLGEIPFDVFAFAVVLAAVEAVAVVPAAVLLFFFVIAVDDAKLVPILSPSSTATKS